MPHRFSHKSLIYFICQNSSQQGQMIMQKPTKSLSARNFFKRAIQERQQRKKIATLHTEPVASLTPGKRLASSRTEIKSYRNHTVKVRDSSFHPPEVLHEQNLKLKTKVNRLTQELTREKVKRTQDTRHLTKMQKQIEVQFEDDKYLDVSRNHNKLIQGVKHQYHKMKQMYESKCKEYNQLLKRYELSAGQQSRFECQSLQQQNKKLRQKLEILLATEQRIAKDYQNQKNMKLIELDQSVSKAKITENQILDILGISSQFMIMSKKIQDLELVNKQQERKLDKMKVIILQKGHKIAFLDKLLIEKSNQNHHLIMKQRKTSKENKNLFISLEDVRLKLSQESQARRLDLQYLKQKEKIKFETEKAIFIQSIQQKDEEIEKLREELKYVSTLIQYLKMGDENINMESSFNPLAKKTSKNSHDYIRDLEVSLSSLKNPNEAVRQRVKTLFESNKKQLQQSQRGLRGQNSPRLQANTESLKKINMNSDDEDMVLSVKGSESDNSNEDIVDSRVVKKSYLKHHNDIQRIKPVKIEQLQNFRLDLMYRFIYYNIGTDDAKRLLDYERQEGVSKRQAKWRCKYINFKEAKRLMMAHPFLLDESQATLLARYVVEDATKDDVFFHEQNEIQRAIAKSILRAFVGEYSLPNPNTSRQQIKQMLSTNSGKNLSSALQTLAPSGTISWQKMMQICRGIQVEFTDRTWNFIFSQLCHHSQGGIMKLNYSLLFSGL